jgi:hypothetical protein
MTVIDNVEPKSPIFTYTPPPAIFKTEYEEQKYWQEEKRRWLEGYGDMTGALYFYATQIKLKNRVTGEIFRPTVRDADLEIFKAIEDARKEGKALYFLKARGVGFSSIGMALPFYFFRIYPNSNCVATSKDKKTLATLFKDKTMVAYDNLESPYVRPDMLAKNETASESFLSVGMKYINNEGNEKYATSNLYCRDTQESEKAATNFSGGGAIYGFADEASLMPRLMTFFNSAIEIFKDTNGKIAGTLVLGGTAEENMGAEHIQKIQNIWENADAMNIKPLFLPATYGKYMTNGWSDHKKAEEEILKEREKKSKLNDGGEALKAYIKNHPLSIEDIFDFGGSSRWDDYAIEKINLQAKHLSIPSNQPSIGNYSIVERDNEMVAIPNSKSTIKILEHPQPNTNYILGIDATMSTDNTSGKSGNSKFALMVMKGVHPQSKTEFAPVCTFMERPRDFETTFDTAIRVLKYYNKYGTAKIAGELNATGGVLVEKIQRLGMANTIIARKDLNKTGWVNTKKAWFYRVDSIIDWQYTQMNRYFKKYSEKVQFIELIQDAQKADSANTDILDAFAAAIWGFGSGDILEGNTNNKAPKQVVGVRYVQMRDGNMGWESYDITTGKPL